MDENGMPNLKEMAARWPLASLQTAFETFTGGIISRSNMAILDSQGRGIKDRIRMVARVNIRSFPSSFFGIRATFVEIK
jgi:hypothetical protein